MKLIDMKKHTVVRCGKPWPHADLPAPRDMALHLERNEALVSWLQPLHASMQEQFPAIYYNGKFLSLSMRMMKSVWRHVRLKKGFVNRQTVPEVGTILRIPHALLVEKIRTQQRFNVSIVY